MKKAVPGTEATEEATEEKVAETDLTVDRERCIRQPVPSAARNAKFRSSP